MNEEYGTKGRKINLRKDAKFDEIESVKDLYDKYMLELKLRRRHKSEGKQTWQEEDTPEQEEQLVSGIERIIMLRYVVFASFTQAIYPLVYIIIVRRLIGTTLAHKAICVDNKMSAESRDPIALDASIDIMNEAQIVELEYIYNTLLNSY